MTIAVLSAVGAAVLTGLLFIAFIAGTRSGGADSPPKAPAKSAEEARREQISAASAAAWNSLADMERKSIATFPRYDEECAAAIARHYRTLDLTNVDSDFKVWVNDLIAAADTLVDDEKERRTKLRDLEAGRDDRARQAAADTGGKFAEGGETAGKQVGRGILGGLAGALASNINTELDKNKLNEVYGELLAKNSAALKRVHEQRSTLLQTLMSRYSWTSK